MHELQGEGGLRPALLPARLVQLAGAERLSCVHAIMDTLRGASIETNPAASSALQKAIAEHLPSLDGQIRSVDLIDHQNQDLPLAIFLLTHPALQRGTAPLLLLRTLAGWRPAELARLCRTTPARVENKLNAGARRIRVLRLGMTWPDFRELSWRVKHAIEVIEQLETLGRSRRFARNIVCRYARGFLEALARNPSTTSPWVVERWWRIRYAESATADPNDVSAGGAMPESVPVPLPSLAESA